MTTGPTTTGPTTTGPTTAGPTTAGPTTAGTPTAPDPTRVVLLGGGYVVLHAYAALVRRVRRQVRRGEVEIAVVSADDHHSFHGFTGEVASGRLPTHLTRTPLAEVMPLARVVHARVEHVDLERRVVTYAPADGDGDGDSGGDRDAGRGQVGGVPGHRAPGATLTLGFDLLVVGTGSAEPLDGVPGLAGRGVSLRRVGGLAALAEQAAAAGADGRPVVVVGGGLAGAELAAALADRAGPTPPPKVVLVHSGDRLVPALRDEQPRLAARCEAELARLGVEVRTGTRVLASDDTGVTLSDGTTVESGTVLATTGQRPVLLPGLESLARDPLGRLVTTPDLHPLRLITPTPTPTSGPSLSVDSVSYSSRSRLKVTESAGRVGLGARAAGHVGVGGRVPVTGVWAAGDAARVLHPRTGRPVRANALWAIKAGDQVGRNVARALRGRPEGRFRYLGLGQAASFGTGRGVAELYGVPITGWAAWLLRLGFFLRFMPSRSRAVRIPWTLVVRRGRAPSVGSHSETDRSADRVISGSTLG